MQSNSFLDLVKESSTKSQTLVGSSLDILAKLHIPVLCFYCICPTWFATECTDLLCSRGELDKWTDKYIQHN